MRRRATERVGCGVGELEGAAHEDAAEDAAGGVALLRVAERGVAKARLRHGDDAVVGEAGKVARDARVGQKSLEFCEFCRVHRRRRGGRARGLERALLGRRRAVGGDLGGRLRAQRRHGGRAAIGPARNKGEDAGEGGVVGAAGPERDVDLERRFAGPDHVAAEDVVAAEAELAPHLDGVDGRGDDERRRRLRVGVGNVAPGDGAGEGVHVLEEHARAHRPEGRLVAGAQLGVLGEAVVHLDARQRRRARPAGQRRRRAGAAPQRPQLLSDARPVHPRRVRRRLVREAA
mmetsp:Transcript_16460/g.57414  ORF Transcript_16460/g.57414 Transcript_16460/m.57414 type:complete len:289 (+) Transcript_16460:587-1453(+)